MKSKWFESENSAISLRKKGLSIRYIETKLGIPRSTLSGWFKDIELTKKQKTRLHKNWLNGLIKARKKATLWHNNDKNERRKAIRQDVERFASSINIDKNIQEIILATFYLAEGGKKENNFTLANSNPEILESIATLLRNIFILDESKFRCCLHLRKDQDDKSLKEFWSKTLGIPKSKFLKTQFDKRTIEKTYDHYKGVCVLLYYDMALQRRILFLGEKLVSIINNKK